MSIATNLISITWHARNKWDDQGLDRHSQFFEAEEYKSFQENTKRSYVGIGIMIRNNSQGE